MSEDNTTPQIDSPTPPHAPPSGRCYFEVSVLDLVSHNVGKPRFGWALWQQHESSRSILTSSASTFDSVDSATADAARFIDDVLAAFDFGITTGRLIPSPIKDRKPKKKANAKKTTKKPSARKAA